MVTVFGCGFPSLPLAWASVNISLNFLSPLIKQLGMSLDFLESRKVDPKLKMVDKRMWGTDPEAAQVRVIVSRGPLIPCPSA